MRQWTHNELQTDLANHLHAGGQMMVWTNIVMGQAGAPRPDVLTLDPVSWSAINLVAFEVKISVSDFRSDVTKGKWQQYLEFAQGVTFAAPAGLLSAADVPKSCGLIERGSERWRYRRRPTLGTYTLTQVQMLKLAREPRHRPTLPYTNPTADDYWTTRLDRARAKLYRDAKAQIGRRLGKRIAMYLDDGEGADALVDKARKEAARIIENARSEAQHHQASWRAACDDLAKALGLPPGQTSYALQRAITAAAKRLAEHGEIAHLREQLHAIEMALQKARPIPTEIET